jgi:rRNA maturation endonuclease Nob1
MTEPETKQAPAEPPKTPPQGGQEPPAKTFTQEDLDKIIEKRLSAQKEQHAKELKAREDALAEKERISKLDGEERIKAESKAAIEKAQKEAQEAVSALRIKNAEVELARLGIDTSWAVSVVGAFSEGTVKNYGLTHDFQHCV